MFARFFKSFYKTVTFRLAAWYAGLFTVSLFFLFSLAYLLLSSSLQKQDRQAVQLKSADLATLLQTEGAGALDREIRIVRKFKGRDPFFIRLADPDNRTLFLLLPYQWTEFDLKTWEDLALPKQETWLAIPAKGKNYVLELNSLPLDGYTLQVGKSTEERQRILQSFRSVFAAVMIPLLVFGLAAGAFLGWRALRPVRHLIQAFQSIGMGRMNARVTSPATGDELEELVNLFNHMMSRIETLINAMAATLDNVAHDLRTPMTRLRGMAEMALASGQDMEKYREALADTLEESERILAMLNALMDISEAESGVMKLDLQAVDLGLLIKDVFGLYELVAEEKSVQLASQLDQGLDLRADPIRLRQVLANLVDNAVKYTPPGGRIMVRAHAGQGEVVIEVEDTGIGIDQAEIPKIWDRLYRGDQSRSQKGLGLGLSLVKAIVTAHKGRVEVRSELGKGSCFKVFLPQ